MRAVGTMPSYSTIYGILCELGHAEGLVTKLAGMNPRYWGKIVIDNVQNYLRQRDMRIGWENKMTVGLAGIHIEYPEGTFAADAPDMADRQEQITKNEH